MCTEREVVRELSMTAASPSEKDVAMEKIPDNNRPLNRSRTPSRSMPSQALMRSSSSSPEVKPEAASKRRVPSPARPRERPVNPPAPAEEKALEGVDSSLASRHMGKPSSPSFVSTHHLHEETSSEVVKASAVPSTTQGRACSSPVAVKSSVSDTTVVSSSSVPGQFAKFSSLMNQLARSSSQSVSLENRCSAAPSPGPSKPPPLSSLKERTRLLPQVTASSPAPRSSSDAKPRLSASTEQQPRAATSSLTSSLVSRPSSPSRTGVVKPAPSSLQAPVVSSRNSNKLTRVPSPSRIYSSQPSSCSVSSSPSSVAFARPSSPSLSRPGSQTSASSLRPSTPTRVSSAPPTTVIAKPRTSTPTRTISTKSPNPSSSSSSILTTRSAIAAKPSSSPAATTTSPNRPLTPTRSLTKPTKSSVTSSSTLLAHHQNQPSSFSSPSFANLKTMASAAGSSQNHARCSSPSESPKSITSSGDCSNNSDTSSSMSSGNVATTRKLMPEFQAQQQQQMAAGFKHIQASHKTSARVVPEGLPMSPTSNVKKRCGWITSQNAALIAYHDEEWGVPIYDERLLFELIVLAGAQAELSWSSILALRDDFRDAFAGFDAAVVAKFNEKKIATLIANPRIRIPEAKVRGAIDNAKRVLEIEEECGSLTNFLWSFVNYKPMVSHYKLSKQVPVKTPKSEALSNELVRRGLRFVGPTTMYVLMQAAGLVNDHLVTCFRHQECASMYDSPPLAGVHKEIQPEKERWSQTDENLSSFSSLFGSKTSPAFEPGPWLNLPVLDTSSRLNSAPCEPVWAELPMIEEAFEDEMEKQTT
ncbi:hypothetical protein CY35_07G109900 [Sphagnum magellanicum]|uniref:Uncharacterized protein n=1 Tax=Sphagnum magellanicum TaxID=128215 RepID=A0ACB8HNU4_9BRYO|nr:hypothetical protein CY35_07G109900 [Sphagnum magellanicum]